MPKERKVIVTLELTTSASLEDLRDREAWDAVDGDGDALPMTVDQVTATVSQSPKARRK